ncbi:MAG: SAM-dependent methyltransferase [Planctomycetota bacterium]|jgi:SAM-dependent methyltransferase
MSIRQPWFLAGLFLVTLTTLCLEVLDTRLLSVMTWYHLSFFAVSTAMFGMSAGALQVYLRKELYEGDRARESLIRNTFLFAISIPISHIANLVIPIAEGPSLESDLGLFISTLALAAPFYLSGVAVAVCLTRIPGKIGLVYAVDLVGAALGSLLVLPLLEYTNISTAVMICGALAAVAAFCFSMAFSARGKVSAIVVSLLLVAAGVGNMMADSNLRIWWPKGQSSRNQQVDDENWNIHSQIMLLGAKDKDISPWYWGPGKGAKQYKVRSQRMIIDGNAATAMTKWDGNRESLKWVSHDVTSLPYHIRKGGSAAIIGVGGGRDILTALWADSQKVTGVEINAILLGYLQNEFREYCGIADFPGVKLVHDEARSYYTRETERYDVLQMSLIDTWAATGAGAFTLTENGLYTIEAWRIFLDVLKPNGIFSVSRWYSEDDASETSRLMALGTAALIDRGIENPRSCMALIAVGRVATLMLSLTPFSEQDLRKLQVSSNEMGFKPLIMPGLDPENEQLNAIVSAATMDELAVACEHEYFDYSPPTDERPFFFNFLKPGSLVKKEEVTKRSPGVLVGNLKATNTLITLAQISLLLVLGLVFLPLVRTGLPDMPAASFLLSVMYFGAIGFGFMMVQISFMQRFSIYLGHPTYAVIVILFSMILMAGVGSWISDKIPAERSGLVAFAYPLAVAGALYAALTLIQPMIDTTIHEDLSTRIMYVLAMVAPVSLLLGLCFPIGMRLVGQISDDSMPWMWGVNGGCGVLGAVLAVGLSMWGGISWNFYGAIGMYGALAIIAPALRLYAKKDTGAPDEPEFGEQTELLSEPS